MGRYRNRSGRKIVNLNQSNFYGKWTLTRGLEPLRRTRKQKHYPALWSPDLSFSFHQHTSPSIKLSLSCTLSPSVRARLCLLYYVWISVCKTFFSLDYTSTLTIKASDGHCSVLLHVFCHGENINSVWVAGFYHLRFLERSQRCLTFNLNSDPLQLWVVELKMKIDLMFFFQSFHVGIFSHQLLPVLVFFFIFFSPCVYFKPAGYFWKQTQLSWGLCGDGTHTAPFVAFFLKLSVKVHIHWNSQPLLRGAFLLRFSAFWAHFLCLLLHGNSTTFLIREASGYQALIRMSVQQSCSGLG